MNIGYSNPYVVAQAAPEARALFIRNTYMHLAGAILAFIAVEAAILDAPFAPGLARTLGDSWLLVRIRQISIGTSNSIFGPGRASFTTPNELS